MNSVAVLLWCIYTYYLRGLPYSFLFSFSLHSLPPSFLSPSPPSPAVPQLETKCFLQQEQLDLLQEQLSSEQERSHTAVSSLQKELALRVDQVCVCVCEGGTCV